MTDTPQKTAASADEPPRTLRPAYRWGLALVLFGGMAAGVNLLSDVLTDPRVLPIKHVRIDGALTNLDRRELEHAVADVVHGGFFTIDLKKVWSTARGLPWVGEVQVRRVWPDGLRLRVQERVAVARWGEDGLLTADGEIFRPSAPTIPQGLPRLSGDDDLAPEVLQTYRDVSQQLAPLGLALRELRRDPRGGWRLTLADGPVVAIGPDRLERSLRRFVRLYPELKARGPGRLLRVDLRYPHGLAVVREPPPVEAEAPAEKPAARPARPTSGKGHA
jgi:cell division protein FtsQ